MLFPYMALAQALNFGSMAAWPQASADPLQAAVDELKDPNPMVRRHGAAALGELRRPEAAAPLLAVIGDSHAYVRATVIDSLGLLRASQAEPAIAQALGSDKEALVRQAAAQSLAYIGDASAGDALISALQDPALGVRHAALTALGALRVASAASEVRKLLNDPDADLRAAAAEALGRMESKESTESLKAMLADPHPGARLKAAHALGRLGDVSGRAAAAALLKDKDPEVRARAARTLAAIGSQAEGLPELDAAYALEKEGPAKDALLQARKDLRAKLGLPAPVDEAPQAKPSAAPKKSAKKAVKKKTPPPAKAVQP